MEKCVFCNLNLERTRIIYKSEKSYIILSNPALMKGHCLVIPKRHVEKLSELGIEERKDLLEQIIQIEERLLKKFPGCDIRQNYRPFQQQSNLKINHLHFHLQPRELYDELYKKSQIYETQVFKFLSSEEAEALKNFILT
mgnify:CR=1 FL=1